MNAFKFSSVIDWTTPQWQSWVKPGGYVNLNYTCQITHGGLITIG